MSIIVLFYLTTIFNTEASPKIKNVAYLYDQGSSRRIGYVVTKVHPMKKDNELRRSSNVTEDQSQGKVVEIENGIDNRNISESNQAKGVDRTAFIDDGHGT